MILKIAKTVCLIVLLLTMGWSVVRAEEPLPLRLQELAKEQTMLLAGGVIALLIIIFLVVYGYRCNRHSKRMKLINNKLRLAYVQLEETTKAKERVESELRIARQIQQQMLPRVFPRREDVDMYAMMTPAKEVGGDLYAYALFDDQLYFCVADFVGDAEPSDDLTKMCIKL